MRLKNKVSIITGAGSGIGKAIAMLFSREGSRVVVADLSEESGKDVVREIKKKGGKAIFVRVDVSKSSEVKGMVDETVSSFGRIDILVNNAGIYKEGTVEQMSESDWERIIDINLNSAFLCSKYAIPHMRKSRKGVIINMSSVAGLGAEQGMSAYSVSKAGLAMLTRCMALDYARDKIRVNAICPGPILTPMVKKAFPTEKQLKGMADSVPLKRIGKPEEVAELALFLASDSSSYITGGIYTVDGGWTA